MDSTIILQQMAVILILVLIGMYLAKKSILDEPTSKNLSRIVVDVVNPATILASVLTGSITATHKDLINGFIVGFILYAIFIILGIIIPLFFPIPKNNRKFYNMMFVYTNTGFIGIPVALAILPANAMIYIIIINIIYSLLFYTHGMIVMGNENEKFSFKNLLSPGLIVSIFTLVVFWFGLDFPKFIDNTATYLGNATTFLAMAMLGASIARSNILKGFISISNWLYVVVRLVVTPVIVVLILKRLGFSNDLCQAMCLMAAVPAANMPLMYATKTGQDTEILAGGIIISTLLCFITIPLLMGGLF